LLTLIAIICAGCGTVSSPGTSAPSAVPRSSTLTYAFPDDPTSAATATAWIKGYAAVNPAIHITAQPLPANAYAEQLLARIDQTAPDLFSSADTQVPALIKRNALLDLQPLLPSLSVKPDDFQPSSLAAWRHGSAVYGLPATVTPQVLFYNRDLFDAQGLAYPAPGWTWDDWLTTAKKLTVTSSGQATTYGTTLAGWSLMVWGDGGELTNPEGTRSLLDSPEAARGVQFAADMVNVYHVAPPPVDAGGPDPIALFKAQRAAMLPASSTLATSLIDAKLPFKWGIVVLPAGAVPVSPLSVTGLSVSTRSPNADAALAFAAWTAGPAGSAITARLQPFVAPALRSAPQHTTDVPGTDAISQALANGRTLPAITQWPMIAALVNQALVPVWQGHTTAKAAYSAVTPKINALLAAG
jgi:multiple sugar transport system substrate-binding protein